MINLLQDEGRRTDVSKHPGHHKALGKAEAHKRTMGDNLTQRRPSGKYAALFFSVASNGVISVTASSLAMQSQGHRAGSASAVLGVAMFTLGGISVPVTGIGGTSVMTMAATIFGCYMLAIVMFTLLAQKPKKV